MKLKVGILFNLPNKPARGESIDYLAEAEVLDQVDAVQNSIRKLGLDYRLFPLKDDVEDLVTALKQYKPDVVVNLCEGFRGNSHLEMHVPAMLEILGIPYTGAGPLALGLCQDKGLAKDVLRAHNVPTPKYQIMKEFGHLMSNLKFPLFVKPLKEDASIGISKRSFVRDVEELKAQVDYVNKVYGQPALVEEYIDGRELNVSVLGDDDPLVLPISEIIFDFQEGPKIVDYASKWLKESEEYARTKPVCPADLDDEVRGLVEDVALKAYRALRCRDYARVDIRLESRTKIPFVLEVNPNPDISPEAGFNRSLKAANITFEDFIMRVLNFALKRCGKQDF
ncbi:ATP-grasp domain-containing protein [Candidatus Bathyarchaeota archaeon]|nr:ATP-grasp domain-containing protein [Candidatus Bathyarchaeota archaeon]